MSDILTETRPDGVATVTMNRGDAHNAFDEAVIADLAAAFQGLGADPAVRLILLRGVGQSFSAGADLGWMQRMAGYSHDENVADAMGLAVMLRTLDTCPKPTVAVVQGPAYGGGVGLIAACDMAVCADTASFALTEVTLGLIPAVISPYVVAALGERACRRYFLTAERFSAAEALRLGLVHEVAPTDRLDGAVEGMVAKLLDGAPLAQGAVKELIRAVVNHALDDALVRDTAERIARQRVSDEGREGIGAFLAKRKPAWQNPPMPKE